MQLPTRYGTFTLYAYKSLIESEPHLAVCCGGIGELGADGQPILHDEPVMVRVHSECATGDIFGSLRCDCGEQLHDAMYMIQKEGKGAIIYLRQEGRGIGLHNKLRAYELQEQGFDTVEANEKLGFPPTSATTESVQILRNLGLRNLRILTNNPKKVNRLEVYGLQVVEQLPIQVPANDSNRAYLNAKREKMGHLLDES